MSSIRCSLTNRNSSRSQNANPTVDDDDDDDDDLGSEEKPEGGVKQEHPGCADFKGGGGGGGGGGGFQRECDVGGGGCSDGSGGGTGVGGVAQYVMERSKMITREGDLESEHDDDEYDFKR